jgi:putative peptide zinc metalloprotease protein
MGKKAWSWSGGEPPRQALVLAGAAALVALLTWAWWPSGQYRPVRPTDRGTLAGAFQTVSAPATVARPADAPSTPTTPATQLPFTLPDAPGEGDSQALATNTTDGGIVYDVGYSLVTVSGGDPVDSRNCAYALASCDGCTTSAVSFQLVLVVGQSDRIMPINVAEALNLDCPACITTAIAKQIVVSVTSAPSEELLRRLTAELQKLDAIDANDSPADVLAQVNAVTEAIRRALDERGSRTRRPRPRRPPRGRRRRPKRRTRLRRRGPKRPRSRRPPHRPQRPRRRRSPRPRQRRRRRRRRPRPPPRRDHAGGRSGVDAPSEDQPRVR